MTHLAFILAMLAAEQALDATVCRQDRPAQCMCVSLIVDAPDAGGIAQLAAWIGDNPGWVVKTIGKCVEKVVV